MIRVAIHIMDHRFTKTEVHNSRFEYVFYKQHHFFNDYSTKRYPD